MANFHTDQLVIAAREESMKNVLLTMAHNLKTRKLETYFEEDVESVHDIKRIYDVVSSYIDPYYWLIFTPAEGDLDDPRNAAWSGTNPLSETANVFMRKRGDLYVLSIEYSTRNASNEDEVLELIDSLPEGEYGFSFFDADEYDDYWDVSFFAGETLGNEMSRVITHDSMATSEELWNESMRISDEAISADASLAQIAYKFGVIYWGEYSILVKSNILTESQLSEGLKKPSFLDEFSSMDGFAGIVSQPAPVQRDLKDLYEAAFTPSRYAEILDETLSDIGKLPVKLGFKERLHKEQVETMNKLVPGIEMRLGAGYSRPDGDEFLCSRIYTVNGRYVGPIVKSYKPHHLAMGYNPWSAISQRLARTLILLAPFLDITVDFILPERFREDTPYPSSPNFTVEVNLKQVDFSELVSALKERIEGTVLPDGFEFEKEGELPW